jgi:ubiquitin
MPDLETLRRKLADASQEARNLTVMAMNPKHPPEKAELLRNAERSARAEVKLRQKALAHAQGQT